MAKIIGIDLGTTNSAAAGSRISARELSFRLKSSFFIGMALPTFFIFAALFVATIYAIVSAMPN